jgi:DNA-binding MltR family transcriptional regulator
MKSQRSSGRKQAHLPEQDLLEQLNRSAKVYQQILTAGCLQASAVKQIFQA